MTTRTIEITSFADGKRTYAATFEPVRKARLNKTSPLWMTLGWATMEAEGSTFRFPAIVTDAASKLGYTVYTTQDWQAPEGAIGDLSDPLDWALLRRTGTGQFSNPRLEYGNPISTVPLDLPLNEEEQERFEVLTARGAQ